MNLEVNKIYEGDAIKVLETFPDESIDCCISSPPYFGLRDYGTAAWEGGDIDCDHKKPISNTYTTLEGGQSTQINACNYLKKCGKCGAVRIDNQIGLEETPSCNLHGYYKLKSNLSEEQKKKIIQWLLDEGLPNV